MRKSHLQLTKSFPIGGLCAMLAGCVSTQEMPLAPNSVRIDTRADGMLFTGQVVPKTMTAAARATLARGYTHFTFSDTKLQQSSELAGISGASSGSFRYTSFDRAPTASSAATVIMFHANDPEAKNAFNAEDVLRQYGGAPPPPAPSEAAAKS